MNSYDESSYLGVVITKEMDSRFRGNDRMVNTCRLFAPFFLIRHNQTQVALNHPINGCRIVPNWLEGR